MREVAPWVHTFTGRAVDLLTPRPEQLALADIAHSLARLVRFNGHCRDRYTVAEHSVRVALRVEQSTGRWPDASRIRAARFSLAGLLHDAAEAYIGDVVQPLKTALGMRFDGWTGTPLPSPLKPIEAALQDAIACWSGIRPADFADPLIRRADLELLATEKRDLLSPAPRPWVELPEPLPERILEPWSDFEAEHRFVEAFARLRSASGLSSYRVEGAGYEAP